MAKRKFLFFNNSATDAALINSDRITDIEISSATEIKIHYFNNDNALATTAIGITSGSAFKVVRALCDIISSGQDSIYTIADDVNSVYMRDVVSSTGSVGHS
tara:strand:+ start:94 stop:399 length:306 start_codon:yes stop_codon:yes gene_type:complete